PVARQLPRPRGGGTFPPPGAKRRWGRCRRRKAATEGAPRSAETADEWVGVDRPATTGVVFEMEVGEVIGGVAGGAVVAEHMAGTHTHPGADIAEVVEVGVVVHVSRIGVEVDGLPAEGAV